MVMAAFVLGADAQQSVGVVRKFGDIMQKWCNTDEIEYRDQITKLAPETGTGGNTKCLVDDRITQEYVKNDTTGLRSKGTQEILTYLNIFQKAIMEGQKFEMSNVRLRPDFVEPTVLKNDFLPEFVSADLALSGNLCYNITDIFYVRDGMISKIIDYSSDYSLGKALELYSKKKYDEAFKLFRKLAYDDFGNFDAQYYMVVMEIKKQGCASLDKKFRDKEIAWFTLKNVLARQQNAMKLVVKFPIDDRELDYAHYSSLYEWIVRCKQPAQSGLMMSFDSKTLTAGFINEIGKQVVPYGKYSVAYPFHEGRSLVVSKVTQKCGFIDENGNEAVPIIYQNAICDFYKGRTWCLKDGAAYLVDNQGKVLKTVQGYSGISTYAPSGRYAMLYKSETTFDIYDYDGNLCYEDYTSWFFEASQGLVKMVKEDSPDIYYRIEW